MDFAVKLENPSDCGDGCCSWCSPMIVREPAPVVCDAGPLWKLNSISNRTDNFALLENWRYRQFYLLSKGQIAAAAYISEKDGGNIVLACSLKKSASQPLEALPQIAVEPLSFEKANSVYTSVRQYSIAFCGEGVQLMPHQDPQESLPSSLFPFCVTWRDASNNEQKLIVSATTEASRDEWMTKIAGILR